MASSRGTRTSSILGFIAQLFVWIARAWTQISCAFFIAPVVYIYARIINKTKLQGRTTDTSNLFRGASLQFEADDKNTGKGFSFRALTGVFVRFASSLKLSVSKSALAIFAVVVVLAPIGMLSFDLLSPEPAQAATNEEINFQARLLTAGGGLVPDGNYNVQFTIYSGGDGDLGGGDETLEWSGSHLNTNGDQVVVKNGYVSARLGTSVAQVNTLADVDWNDDTLWLSINIGNTGSGTPCTTAGNFNSNCGGDGEMDPFMRFTSTPYAFNSKQLGGREASEFVQLNPGATPQAVNTTNSAIAVNQQGTGNLIQLQDGGTDRFVIADGGAATLTGTLAVSSTATFSGASVTIGSNGTAGTLRINDGDNEIVTIAVADAVSSFTVTVPDAGGADTFCLQTLNNCSVDTSVTLQDAYDNGNTIVADNGDGDIDFTVSEATNFTVDITGTGVFAVQDSGTAVLSVTSGSATTITNADGGADVALTINGGTSTGNIIEIEDNGTDVLTVADGGAITATGTLDVAGNVAFGAAAAVNDTTLVNAAVTMSNTLTLERGITNLTATDQVSGIVNYLEVNPGATGTANVYGSDTQIEVIGSQDITASIYGSSSTITTDASASGDIDVIVGMGSAVAHNSTGLVGAIYGSINSVVTDAASGDVVDLTGELITIDAAGTVTNAIAGSSISVQNSGSSTFLYGSNISTINNSFATAIVGQYVGVTNSGTGTGENLIGLYVEAQDSGTLSQNSYGIQVDLTSVDYGIAVAAGSDATLWLGHNVDSTSEAGGIVFGLSQDTNLYRSAANTLRTDDALYVGGVVTLASVGAADTNTLLCRNSSNQIATCTPGYDATVTLQDAYDNGNTIVADNSDGDIDLTVSEATNFSVDITGTGSFLVQDSGSTILAVADGTGRVDVTGDLDVSSQIAVGSTASVTSNTLAVFSETYSANSGTLNGVSAAITLNPGSASSANAYASSSSLAVSGQNHTGFLYGDVGTVANNGTGTLDYAFGNTGAVQNTSSGNIALAQGSSGLVLNSGTGDITYLAAGVNGSVMNTNTGDISTAAALVAGTNVNSGGGTITSNYGLYVQNQTAGTTDYGIYVADAQNYSLYLASTDGDAASGITFGGDTNLYRVSANTLRTNDALTVDGLVTGTLGATISGATTSINASSNFATNINTGTSTGAVSIGNSSAGAISLTSGSTVGINGTTTVTGLTSGVALTVNNSTSTGNIFVAQDNGTPVFTIADSGGITGTGTYTFSGVATDITSGTDEDLLVLSNGTGAARLDSTGTGSVYVGNSAFAKTIQIGNGTGATGLYLYGGTSGISIGNTAVSNTVQIGPSDSAVANTFNIGNNINAGGTSTVTIGSTQNASSITIQSGTGDVAITSQDDINIGTNAVAQDITIGNTTGASSLTLASGTGTIAIGTGAQARTINIGTGAAAQTVTLGSTNTTSTTTIQAGSGGVVLVGSVAGAASDSLVCRNGSNQLSSCGGNTLSGYVTMQNAYVNGNTITATNAEGDIDLTVSEATNFSVDITGTGNFYVQDGGTNILTVADGGALTVSNPSGSDVALTVNGGTSTGSIFVAQDNGTAVMTIADGGAITLQNTTDSTSGFRVMDADGGTPVFNVDTTNERVGIGTATPGHELDVVGDGQFSSQLQVGDSLLVGTMAQCNVILGFGNCTVGLDVGTNSTETTNVTYGTTNYVAITPNAATNTAVNAASRNVMVLLGTQSFSGTNISVLGEAYNSSTSGTVGTLIGLSGLAQQSGVGSTTTSAVGIRTLVAQTGGTLTNAYGLEVQTSTGTISGSNYGIYVQNQTAGATDYGIYVADAANYSLYLASTDGDAASGITFGGDTNLYRAAADTLHTDDSFRVYGAQTTIGDSSGDFLAINAVVNSNFVFRSDADRTLGVAQRGSNAAGRSLTIYGGQAGTGASAFSGGDLILQGGAAGGTGNAAGGNITLTGGAGTGTGTAGLVVISNPTYSTATVQNFTGSASITQANVDTYGTILISSNAAGYTATLGDPSITTAGRVIYITNSGSYDMTLSVNGGGTGNTVTLKPNTTATMIWNGSDWTAAGASSSTDLQAAYNNTATSAGGAELILNASGGAADGLTIRNNATTPITGALLEVQASIGNNLFSVNNYGTEYAANGGAEDSSTFSTNWALVGSASAPTRTTTAGQFATGQAAASVTTTTAANDGIRNNLATTLATSTTYQVSFSAKLASGTFTTLDVQYSRDGGTDLEACTNYSSQTLSTTIWTKITCDITTDGTSPTNSDLIIRQSSAGTARTFYIDNLSIRTNNSSSTPPNVQIGGGINGGAVTLFTLDQASSPPVASGDSTYYGSMYYDTVTGRIQCYEADGWGACGSPPNNIITLTPEYGGAVLNGTGVGTMQADFCSDQSSVLQINEALCDTGEAVNYYEWTSPQATSQTYSIYVTFQLPTTFEEFASNSTMTLDGRSTETDDANVTYEVFRSTGSAITECGSDTTVTSSDDTWQTVAHNGNEQSGCSFAGGDRVIFKLNMTARNNESVYVSDINFTYTNE